MIFEKYKILLLLKRTLRRLKKRPARWAGALWMIAIERTHKWIFGVLWGGEVVSYCRGKTGKEFCFGQRNWVGVAVLALDNYFYLFGFLYDDFFFFFFWWLGKGKRLGLLGFLGNKVYYSFWWPTRALENSWNKTDLKFFWSVCIQL